MTAHQPWTATRAANTYSWMRENCHMTGGAAVSAVCVGDNAARLERSVHALDDGRIGFAHLSLLASTAEAIDHSPTASALFDETRLLAKAETISLKRFRIECAHLRHAADREAFLAAQVEERVWSSLRMRSLTDGGLELTGYLDAEGGALVRTALEPLAARRGPDDDRCVERRCADPLLELCGHSLDAGLLPQRASQRSHLQVTTTLETLLDLVGARAGKMEHAGVIAGATVQRLACDATITRILVDAHSAIVDVGRSERVVRGATRRALNVRDRGCRWPGCDRTASWTAAHHVVHWARGGPPTSPISCSCAATTTGRCTRVAGRLPAGTTGLSSPCRLGPWRDCPTTGWWRDPGVRVCCDDLLQA